jgi:hypothetical protein
MDVSQRVYDSLLALLSAVGFDTYSKFAIEYKAPLEKPKEPSEEAADSEKKDT